MPFLVLLLILLVVFFSYQTYPWNLNQNMEACEFTYTFYRPTKRQHPSILMNGAHVRTARGRTTTATEYWFDSSPSPYPCNGFGRKDCIKTRDPTNEGCVWVLICWCSSCPSLPPRHTFNMGFSFSPFNNPQIHPAWSFMAIFEWQYGLVKLFPGSSNRGTRRGGEMVGPLLNVALANRVPMVVFTGRHHCRQNRDIIEDDGNAGLHWIQHLQEENPMNF